MIMNPDGGTISTAGLPLPTSGYWVGGAPIGSTNWLGYWRDSETGLYHLDGVDHFNTLGWATLKGRDRKEIAIWDIANGREIRL